MPVDKSWMHLRTRNCPEYEAGVKKFIERARLHVNEEGKIRCPCVRCYNGKWFKPELVEIHCLLKGFSKTYQTWYFHGEQYGTNVSDEDEDEDDDEEEEDEGDEMVDVLQDIAGPSVVDTGVSNDDDISMMPEHRRTEEGQKLDELFKEVDNELYPGCKKFSSLNFLVKLMHIKVLNRWTNKSFDMLLELLKDAFPADTKIPSSHYEARKKLNDLGLGYENIHVCKHDCAIFWKENADLQNCPICKEPRYQMVGGKGKKVPHKVMRYFPLTPRLKRLYASRHTAEDMRWHYDKRSMVDGVLRHPADGEEWKEFDIKYPDFSSEPRNVRLGLASDGFNPFGNMSNAYSMWPVIFVPYNLPPWKYMKQIFFMMSLLIPGPKSPGRDMDIFLRPIVDELKLLWAEGVDVYDASRKESFTMRAALLWTVNDFPAYSLLSGWSTKGYKACPVCNEETSSKRLKDKICYMGHRRYLPIDHKWRNSRQHDGTREHRLAPKLLTGEQILMQLDHVSVRKSGKHPSNKDRKRKHAPNELNWYKKSIFFELEYWSALKLRHNLDVMHIEKNICDNVVGTLLSIEGKTKDTYKAREDLAALGIRKELWLQTQGNKVYKPPASYTLTLDERRRICKWLKSVKVPDGYSSNISRCINEGDGKISGLKTHDCHILLQRLLPVGIRSFLNKHESGTLIELSHFFQQICSRTLYVKDLEVLQEQIVVILCKLERMFPPAFFDVMVHLAIHLPYEAMLAGPVQSRWMYPFERALGTYKQYVRNKARPEGSIAEAYIVNESLTFCSMYLRGMETRFNRPERNDELDSHLDKKLNIFATGWRPLGKARIIHLDDKTLKQAHWYLLNNCPEVQPFIKYVSRKLFV